jgi:hypothetical protein
MQMTRYKDLKFISLIIIFQFVLKNYNPNLIEDFLWF